MQTADMKIKKYLDRNNRYNPLQSELVRQAYKDSKVKRQGPISKLFNAIFKLNLQ